MAEFHSHEKREVINYRDTHWYIVLFGLLVRFAGIKKIIELLQFNPLRRRLSVCSDFSSDRSSWMCSTVFDF